MNKVYEKIAEGVARLLGKEKPVGLVVSDAPTPIPAFEVPPEHHIHIADPVPPPRPLSEAPLKIPSKSRCLKLLRDAYGPTTRFQTMSDGEVQIWTRGEGAEGPILGMKAREKAGEPALYYMATCAAFRRLGFALELYENRIEIVPYREGDPRHANSQIHSS